MSTKIAIVYYSATGHVHQLAQALAAGAEQEGAEVRLRRVAELAPPEAIAANPAWQAHHDATQDVAVATADDLIWADGYALGTPTRFGNPAAQLKQFIDTLGGAWQAGQLANKAATAFTSAMNTHGGNESTILAVENVFHHWGSVIVPPGYTDASIFANGGNPYGTAVASGALEDGNVPEGILGIARYQGARLAKVAALLGPLRG
ncbi:NAD(P)H:quinone oxidoreductase [Patulibacter defluvii]|uniref:NAD(P)H:quinone oxidoreductase n=1 Tax=Patulibacter defluvii TaxID=3095358 RepID=UPI002A756452|nr:NAD(P)H:quinone oxidoreductase [Patulibacter sp. DM4]